MNTESHFSSFKLSPHKISLLILVTESLTNEELRGSRRHQRVFSYLIQEMGPDSTGDKPLHDLLGDLKHLSKEDSYKTVLLMKLEGFRSPDDLYQYCSELKNLRQFIFNPGHLASDMNSEPTGLLDHFIRRCILSFSTYRFEDICKLFDELQNFRMGSMEQNFNMLSMIEVENFVHHKASTLETSLTLKPYSVLKKELNAPKIIDYPKVHFLNALLETEYKNEKEAIYDLHRYFDHSLKTFADPSFPNDTKIQYSSLNLANACLRLGKLDKARTSLIETVKMAQNNNDREILTRCLISMCHIVGILGSHHQERVLLENCVADSHNSDLPLLFAQASINYAQLASLIKNFTSDHSLVAQTLKAKELPWVTALNSSSRKLLRSRPETRDFTIVRVQQVLTKATNFRAMGSPLMTSLYVSNVFQNYKKLISDREVVSNLYKLVERSVYDRPEKTMMIMEAIHRRAPIRETTAWDLTLLMTAHSWSLLRGEFREAEYLEDVLKIFVRGKEETINYCDVWSKRNERLLLEGNLNSCKKSVLELIKFCKNKGYDQLIPVEQLKLARVYKEAKEYHLALNEALSIYSQVKDQNTNPTLCKTVLVLAEILLHLDFSYQALEMLSRVHPISEENCDNLLKGELNLVKAKCLLDISKKVTDERVRESLVGSALKVLSNGLRKFLALNALFKIREVYYLMARTYHELRQSELRDRSALNYMHAHDELNGATTRQDMSSNCLMGDDIYHYLAQRIGYAQERFQLVDPVAQMSHLS